MDNLTFYYRNSVFKYQPIIQTSFIFIPVLFLFSICNYNKKEFLNIKSNIFSLFSYQIQHYIERRFITNLYKFINFIYLYIIFILQKLVISYKFKFKYLQIKQLLNILLFYKKKNYKIF